LGVVSGLAASQGYHKLVISDSNIKDNRFCSCSTGFFANYFHNIIDFTIQNQLKVHFLLIKINEWNPAEYNVCGAAEILNGKYDSLEVRLHSFNIKMDAIPAEAAKANIKSNIRAYCSWDLSKFRWVSVFQKI
jgi:hypothetical protein